MAELLFATDVPDGHIRGLDDNGAVFILRRQRGDNGIFNFFYAAFLEYLNVEGAVISVDEEQPVFEQAVALASPSLNARSNLLMMLSVVGPLKERKTKWCKCQYDDSQTSGYTETLSSKMKGTLTVMSECSCRFLWNITNNKSTKSFVK